MTCLRPQSWEVGGLGNIQALRLQVSGHCCVPYPSEYTAQISASKLLC